MSAVEISESLSKGKMMQEVGEIDAIRFSKELSETYLRYLFTSHLISDREPELQQAFEEAMRNESSLVKGPLISCTPCYNTSFSLKELVEGRNGIHLHNDMLRLSKSQLDPHRPLYSHQVEAIKRLGEGRNLVVATGTGSGKTECFLLPILEAVLADPTPGLCAIIIYPMNALANDQLGRLQELLRELPQVTFGRYTGDTPRTAEPGGDPPRPTNERYSRAEMREEPPHILLTNFAMLEYLLLRPKDSDLFKNQRLRYVVLDEAHTYSGAQGIEISLLMRRLCQHLKNDENNIQFVLTSATLGDKEGSRDNIAQFAKDLTGSVFTNENVLTGETVGSFNENCVDLLSADTLCHCCGGDEDFDQWSAALSDPELLGRMLRDGGFRSDFSTGKETSKLLFDTFKSSKTMAAIHDLCSKQPSTMEEINQLLGHESSEAILRGIRLLIALGSRARKTPASNPLLPTRLHFFCRGFSGATICMNPACPEKTDHPETRWSAFFLEDMKSCQHCNSLLLPLLTCFHCGLPVIRVHLNNGKWTKMPFVGSTANTLLATWLEDMEEDEDEPDTVQKVQLCLRCGAYHQGEGELVCCDARRIITLRPMSSDEEGNLSVCPSCGGSRGGFESVLREFRTGEEAPTAVLTETIIRHLPYDEHDKSRMDLPGYGRTLLAFSDSRQRAAFFAPYMQQTTAETAYMGPLIQAIRDAEDMEERPVSFEEVGAQYKRNLSDMPIVVLRKPNDGSNEENEHFKYVLRRKVRSADRSNAGKAAELSLYKSFCSSKKQKTTLQGMGLAALNVEFTEEEMEAFPKNIPELFEGGEGRGWQIIQSLVEIFVQRRAIDFPPYVTAKAILPYGRDILTFHLANSGTEANRHRFRWNPYYAPENARKNAVNRSRQLQLLSHTLNLQPDADQDKLKKLLDYIWENLKQGILVDNPAWPGEFRVDPGCLQVTIKNARWYVCNRCGRLTYLGETGICSMPRCPGTPILLSNEDLESRLRMNHYRWRYSLPPLPLIVKEHTAQLTNEYGKQYQEAFMKGEVNVLSSSTTFEMGIDVGALKAVILRNVPPSTSSYIQRAGRAGRRRDGTSLAVTYSRNMPHDQFHFHHPLRMIQGKVPVPYVNVGNARLAQRHCNSYLLGSFLRSLENIDPKILESPTVEAFFMNHYSDGFTLAEWFSAWCAEESARSGILQDLSGIIPQETNLDPEAALDTAIETILTSQTSIAREQVLKPLERFDEQIKDLRAQLNAAGTRYHGRIAHSLDSLKKLKCQFLQERLIDFLSSCSWLPGYAFPQDVVKLIVRQVDYTSRMRLERDREVGISEYAPGSEIVADALLFKSAGIWFNSREPDIRYYSRCPDCRSILTALEVEQPPTVCSYCGKSLTGIYRPRKYIKPDGFTTLVSEEPGMPGISRRRPAPTSEVFLLEGAEEFVDHDINGISYGIKRGGKLFRANSNYRFRGFYVCRRCGRGFDTRPNHSTHDSPWGTRCHGAFVRLDLAHEIVTDILQLRFQDCTPPPPQVTDKTFWESLLSAFLNGASEALGIATNDIAGTYHGWTERSYIGELVVYDRVPGGAGHIHHILTNLNDVLHSALARVRDCKCSDENSSCYACLRSYANQFNWDNLQRKPVMEWLTSILNSNGCF